MGVQQNERLLKQPSGLTLQEMQRGSRSALQNLRACEPNHFSRKPSRRGSKAATMQSTNKSAAFGDESRIRDWNPVGLFFFGTLVASLIWTN